MVNMFTQAILSAADRAPHASTPRHVSPKNSATSPRNTEEWEELETTHAKFVAPVKIKGDAQT